MSITNGAKKKAYFLAYCLEIGFIEKDQLDELSLIWDRYRDEHGNLRPPVPEPSQEDIWEDAMDMISRMEAKKFTARGVANLLKQHFTITKK